MTAAHIAKPEFWPTPWRKISTAVQRATFPPVLGKMGVFQHYQLEPAIEPVDANGSIVPLA